MALGWIKNAISMVFFFLVTACVSTPAPSPLSSASVSEAVRLINSSSLRSPDTTPINDVDQRTIRVKQRLMFPIRRICNRDGGLSEKKCGKVIANSRRAFTAKILKKNVKSRVAILARDQRFKIRHTKIEHLQESSGYMKNSGYTKVGKWWGSGHKDVTKQLNIVSAELADCIQNPKSEQDDDW